MRNTFKFKNSYLGVIGIIWFILWWSIVAESPIEDRYITKEELNYIKESLGNDGRNRRIKHPWKSFLTSGPVWAIVVSHFSENWGFYTLLTQLPKFLKGNSIKMINQYLKFLLKFNQTDVLDFDMGNTGIMAAIPYLAMTIMLQFAGQWADWFREKGILTTTQVRKIFNCGAFLAQTIFMLATAFWLSKIGAMICLTTAVGFGAFAWAGFR